MHEKDYANSNNSNDATDTQKSNRHFTELNLSPEEDSLLYDVMIQRMEMLDHRRRSNKGDVRMQAQRWLDKEADFDGLMKRLPHEDSLIINRHEADLNAEHADENEYCYKAGFLDGLRLARFVMGIH